MKTDGVKHGTDRAYRVHGCRCDLCKEAHNAARRKERQRRRANSQHDLLFELAEKYGYVLVPIEDFEEVEGVRTMTSARDDTDVSLKTCTLT